MANNKQEFIREIKVLIDNFEQKHGKNHKDINDQLKGICSFISNQSNSCVQIYNKVSEVTDWAYKKTSYSVTLSISNWFKTAYDFLHNDLAKFKNIYKEEDLKEFDNKSDKVNNLELQTSPNLLDYYNDAVIAERDSRSKKAKTKV